MIAIDRLSSKLQELFGGDYVIMPYALLNTQYTTAKQVNENNNVGYVNYYTNEYAKLRKEKIIGVVNLQNPERVNADYYYLTSGFTVDFSVPLNIKLEDSNGNEIGPKTNSDEYLLKYNNGIWEIDINHKSYENITYKFELPEFMPADNTNPDGSIVSVEREIIIQKGQKYGFYYPNYENELTNEQYLENTDKIKFISATPKKYKHSKFDFISDYEEVCAKVINKTIKFQDNFKGKMVIGEPVYQLTESDGEYNYAIYRVSGTFSLGSSVVNFGNEYKVEIYIDNGNPLLEKKGYYELKGINSYTEILNNGANAIVNEGTTKAKQNTAQSAWVCTVSIDDITPGFGDYAKEAIYNILHDNLEKYNQNLLPKEQRKLKIRTTRYVQTILGPVPHQREFWAIVNITFRTTRNGVGTYEISFTDDNTLSVIS